MSSPGQSGDALTRLRPAVLISKKNTTVMLAPVLKNQPPFPQAGCLVLYRPAAPTNGGNALRIEIVFLPENDARLFQIEFVFNSTPRFVGDFAVLQELVNVFPLGSN